MQEDTEKPASLGDILDEVMRNARVLAQDRQINSARIKRGVIAHWKANVKMAEADELNLSDILGDRCGYCTTYLRDAPAVVDKHPCVRCPLYAAGQHCGLPHSPWAAVVRALSLWRNANQLDNVDPYTEQLLHDNIVDAAEAMLVSVECA